MNNFILDMLINVIASFISLLLFFAIFKPNIKISKYISKDFDTLEKKIVYRFKIINKSFLPANEVTFRLIECLELPNDNSKRDLIYVRQIQLTTNEIAHLPAYSIIKTKYTAYAFQTKTFDDIEAILNQDGRFIVLELSAKHAMTGLMKTYRVEFTRSNLKDGKFMVGDNLNIVLDK